MPYQFKNLSVLAYANGFTLWHYNTPDAPADLVRRGAFDPAADMLRAGDIIVANADGGDSRTALLLLVSSADAGRPGRPGEVVLQSLLPAAAN
jgi:hypothetical protein